MKRTSATLALMLIVVLLAAVVSVRLFAGGETGETADGTPADGGIHAPVSETRGTPSLEPIILTPPPEGETVSVLTLPTVETEAPVPTQGQSEAPAQTESPSSGVPAQTDASGTFSSETGTYLNLSGTWTVYTDSAGARKLEVALSATHYSLRCDEMTNGLELNVNGQTYLANSPSISYDGKGFISTPLHTFTVDAPTGAMRVTATWHYMGSYSGKTLDEISASYTYYG